ncbi:hypothetical protein EOM82_02865 [bacterium]|nr:hypothetical protein [bacterium]
MNGIENFIFSVNELLKTNLLNAPEGIKKVLISIANEEEFTKALKKAATGFDFDTEFEKAFIKKQFPNDSNNFVALISATLYALDQGSIGLEELLGIIYPNQETSLSYSSFQKEIIIAYKVEFIKLVKGEPKDTVLDTKPKDLEKMNQEIKEYVHLLSSKIEADSAIEKLTKEDLLTCLYGLSYALDYNDSLLLRVIFTGLINTFFLYRMDYEELHGLTRLLKIYGVL